MNAFQKFLAAISAMFGKKPAESVKEVATPVAPPTPVVTKPTSPLFEPVTPKPEPPRVDPTPAVETKVDARISKVADAIRKISKYSGKYADFLAPLMFERGIDTPLRQIHFLTQIAHESGEFRLVEEGLSYGPAAIKKNFRSYFINADGTWDEAKIAKYQHNPVAFADYVYGSRMGNNGKGYFHRGMGLMQVTGYKNQLAYSMWKYGDDRVVKNPEMLKDLEDAAGSAVYYWISNGLNKWADKDDLLACGRAVNIGNALSKKTPNGQPHRQKMYDLIKPLINEAFK